MPIDQSSPLSLAIAKHTAAKAAWYGQSEAARNSDDDPLFGDLCAAEDELVATPIASDAEFVRKLAYLFSAATVDGDGKAVGSDFDEVIAAVKFHFSPDSETASA